VEEPIVLVIEAISEEIDEKKEVFRSIDRICPPDILVLVIPTNEELMIARDTYRLVHHAKTNES
jgi:acetate kinase